MIFLQWPILTSTSRGPPRPRADMAVGRGGPLLTEINIGRCRNITDMGISALAQGCPFLNNIDLSYAQNITDIGISVLAER